MFLLASFRHSWYIVIMKRYNISTDFLSVTQFAKKIGLHPNTIKKYIKEGSINAIKIGSHPRSPYRIPVSEFNRIAEFNLQNVVDEIIKKRKK